jgi:putative dimethyl sulfoxide reductase chaperone
MPESTTQEANELSQRAALYRLMAQLYRSEVTQELSQKLADTGTLGLLERAGYDLEPQALADSEELTAIRREFSRVFVGPGRHVSPYGSVHHPDDKKSGSLWGETTSRLHRFAKDHGLEFAGKGYDGIPDHVGHELEIYAKLLEGHAQALEDGDDEGAERILNSERYLYRQDLSRWVPHFCRKVRRAAKRPFYAELARLTEELLEEEGAWHGASGT